MECSKDEEDETTPVSVWDMVMAALEENMLETGED